MAAAEHPTCPHCEREIGDIENSDTDLGIVDGISWEVSISGTCPKCGEPINVYATSPLTHKDE